MHGWLWEGKRQGGFGRVALLTIGAAAVGVLASAPAASADPDPPGRRAPWRRWRSVLPRRTVPERGNVRADLELRLGWTVQAGLVVTGRAVHGMGGRQSSGWPSLRGLAGLRRRPSDSSVMMTATALRGV